MDNQKALEILVRAVHVGQAKGAYTLEDAELIATAVKVFVKKEEPKIVEAEKIEEKE